MLPTKSYKDLIVCQKGIELVLAVYRYTETLPREEIYGLTSQMRRDSVSIPSNIAEGYARYHFLDKASIPGRVPAARKSSMAPPPVEIKSKFFWEM